MTVSFVGLALIGLFTIVSAGGGCPYGSQKIGNKCFLAVDSSVNWQAARDSCKTMGGILARIDNPEENTLIKGMIKHDAWIGLNDIKSEGSWESEGSNSKPTYFNWNAGEPNNVRWFFASEDCVLMYSWGWGKGKWNDLFCDHKKNYVCQFKPGAGGGQCPSGGEAIGKKCFLNVESKLNWEEARLHCVKLGGNLATIDSKAENDFASGLIRKKDTWIGLNDRVSEGSFRWAGRNAVPAYLNWAHGEPNNFFWSEDCVIIYGNGWNIRKWNDVNCGDKRPSLCETAKKIVVVPTAAPTPAPPKCHWRSYPNKYVAMNNRKSIKVSRESECKKLCEQETEFVCRSLDYQKSKGTCLLSEISYADAQKQNLIRSSNDYNIYAC